MTSIDGNKENLIRQYETYPIDDLYQLIGNQAIEYGDAATSSKFVVGIPNGRERGSTIVEAVRVAICKSHHAIDDLLRSQSETVDIVGWVGSLADVIVSLKVTGGIPPFAIAVALGKLTDRVAGKLCPDGVHET